MFDYDDLLWNCSSDTLTFDNGASQHPNCVTVITPMAKLVASVINRAIANLDRFDRKYGAARPRGPQRHARCSPRRGDRPLGGSRGCRISEIRLRQSQELLNAE